MFHCRRRVSNSDFTKGATQVSVFSEPCFYSPAYYSPKPLLVRLSASSTKTPSRSVASTPISLQFSRLLAMSRWGSQSQIQGCPPRGFSWTHKVSALHQRPDSKTLLPNAIQHRNLRNPQLILVQRFRLTVSQSPKIRTDCSPKRNSACC